KAEGERFHITYDDGSEEWTTGRFLCVPHLGTVKIKQDRASLYQFRDSSSPIVGELSLDQEVHVGASYTGPGKGWLEVRRAAGGHGYLPGDTALFHVRSLVLLEAQASLHAALSPESPVIGGLKKGDVFTVLDRVEHESHPWLKVRSATGVEGFLAEN